MTIILPYYNNNNCLSNLFLEEKEISIANYSVSIYPMLYNIIFVF